MSYQIHLGSNLDILPTLPDNSVDSIVTDPPYELGFMGKSWDSSGIAYSTELWGECLRVLKPGGHLLAFGGSRTWHRIAVAIEDSGFQVRDSIAWLYGSGFPKSLDISKAIDKAAGAEREVLTKTIEDIFGERNEEFIVTRTGKDAGTYGAMTGISPQTAAATPEAQQWEGWGTALKPAFEPVVVARKPLIGTVAENVLTYGTGGLNIDGSRIGTTVETWPKSRAWGAGYVPGGDRSKDQTELTGEAPAGRWPSNVILDPYTAELLDEQSGISKSQGGATAKSSIWESGKERTTSHFGDTGGASRFFYVAKASKRDRNEGLEELEARRASAMGYDIGLGEAGEGMFKDRNPMKQNFHPTVKPTDLMRYLIKLVTPPGGVVLDPFTGSGSTGKAAILEGFDFIGIELTEEYLPIIEGRLAHAEKMRAEAEAKEDEALF